MNASSSEQFSLALVLSSSWDPPESFVAVVQQLERTAPSWVETERPCYPRVGMMTLMPGPIPRHHQYWMRPLVSGRPPLHPRQQTRTWTSHLFPRPCNHWTMAWAGRPTPRQPRKRARIWMSRPPPCQSSHQIRLAQKKRKLNIISSRLFILCEF